MSLTKRITLMIALVAVLAMPLMAQRRQSTVPRAGTAKHVADAMLTGNYEVFDTVAADTALIVFSGYDKALRATKETMFVTSNVDNQEIGAVIFTISYYDMQGRLLHRRRVQQHVMIPPGETRRLDVPSWDRQNSFYFHRSQRPRVSAVPYKVSITPDTILLFR